MDLTKDQPDYSSESIGGAGLRRVEAATLVITAVGAGPTNLITTKNRGSVRPMGGNGEGGDNGVTKPANTAEESVGGKLGRYMTSPPVIVAAVVYLFLQLHNIDVSLTKLEARLNSHIDRHNGKVGAPGPIATMPPAPPSASAPIPETLNPTLPKMVRVVRGVPVCVDEQSGLRISCDGVTLCREDGYWKADRVARIAEKIGVPQELLLFCMPKMPTPTASTPKGE